MCMYVIAGIIVRVSADSNATQPETKIVGGTLATNRSHFAYQVITISAQCKNYLN